jgi:parallel beta-helix repeat protein
MESVSGFHKSKKIAVLPALAMLFMMGFIFAAPPVHAVSCSPAGTTGLTTLITAHSGQTIKDKNIDATGCDIGIFVPPGSSNVVIMKNTVSGAGIHGIFAQDSSHILIDQNTVTGNSGGVPAVSCDFIAPPCVNEGKAIQLSGVSSSIVSHNSVTNDLFGGIAVTDDGAVDPGALNPGGSYPAVHNIVMGNYISEVSNDCGIVIAVYNAQVASDNMVMNNRVYGSLPPFGVNPYVGQIVVATDGPNATIKGTLVSGNTVVGSTLPGIVIHSNAPGDAIIGTFVKQNTLGMNGYYPPFFSSPNTPVASDGPTGISVVAEAYGQPNAPTISGTTLLHNLIGPDENGVWLCQTTGTSFNHTPDKGSTAVNAVVTCASGGS